MTYNPDIPQPSDIPAQSQDGFFFDFSLFNTYFARNHVQLGNVITNATNGTPLIITSRGHGLSNGDMVTVYDIQGLMGAEAIPWPINGITYAITNATPNTFRLTGADSTTYPPYLPGTGNFSSPSYSYGYHTQLSSPFPLPGDPGQPAPVGSLYSKIAPKPSGKPFTNPDLFFQNVSAIAQLTRLPISKTVTSGNPPDGTFTCYSMVTPWGLIVNFGQCAIRGATSVPGIVTFGIPYTSTPYVAILTAAMSKQLSTDLNSYVVSLTTTQLTYFSRCSTFLNPNTYFLVMGT